MSYNIIWPFHFGPEPAINNLNNWSPDNLKKTRHVNESYTWDHNIVMWHWSADTLFDSYQLTITWMSIRMSIIKFTTDGICLGHLHLHVATVVMPGHYKKIMPAAANQSTRTVLAIKSVFTSLCLLIISYRPLPLVDQWHVISFR